MEMTRTARPVAAAFACLAVVAACGHRKASEIERAPRANPTIPAGKPALGPDSATRPSDTTLPSDTTPRKP
jgi:hypothetical protein